MVSILQNRNLNSFTQVYTLDNNEETTQIFHLFNGISWLNGTERVPSVKENSILPRDKRENGGAFDKDLMNEIFPTIIIDITG